MVRLGELVELSDERNSEERYTIDDVVGISIGKKIIPTKANMDGVSLSSYKVLNPSGFCYVTVTSRNGNKISLALNNSCKTYIVSSSYIVFNVKDSSVLLPEFLFLLFNRPEFDRYARYNSWGSARETFDWEEMQRIVLPLPPIAYQRQLVGIYKGLTSVIEENEALLDPLNAACQAYIVDCKEKYKAVRLGELVEEYNVLNSDNAIKQVKSVSVFKEFRDTNAKVNKNELSNYKIVPPRHIAYVQTTKNEKCFACAINNTDETYVVTSVNRVIYSKDINVLDINFLFLFLNRKEFDRYAIFNSWGSAREIFQYEDLLNVKLPLPPIEVQRSIVSLYHCAEESRRLIVDAREQLRQICPALVQLAKHYNDETA